MNPIIHEIICFQNCLQLFEPFTMRFTREQKNKQKVERKYNCYKGCIYFINFDVNEQFDVHIMVKALIYTVVDSDSNDTAHTVLVPHILFYECQLSSHFL